VSRVGKLLSVGVFCVSLSFGAAADSYTEAMEAAAATLRSAKATLSEAIAEFEARAAAAAAKAAAEAEAARAAAAEAERLKAAADSAAAAKKGKGGKKAVIDTAAAKKDVGVAPVKVDTAAAKAAGTAPAVVDTVAAKVAGVDSAVVDTAVGKAAGVDSAAAVDTIAPKSVAVDSAAVKPAPPKAVAVTRPAKVYPIVKPEIEMVFIKGGQFKMGCMDEQENCVNDERPRHEVRLKDYHIGKYPVTQKQWWSVMGVNPAHKEGENLPVEQVSWNDVQEFIKRLNVLTGKKYRLPTEAEWEYAAYGGAQSNGKKFSGHKFLDDVAWYDYNSFGSTQLVGAKKPNELGVYDMLGNVWEWVGDWYDRYYYKESPLKNPIGPKYGNERVSRGCSFNSEEGTCRISLRNYNKPNSRTIYLGFRLASQ
jgi:formylglycine-generating enzyme required for sulfatase activity